MLCHCFLPSLLWLIFFVEWTYYQANRVNGEEKVLRKREAKDILRDQEKKTGQLKMVANPIEKWC